MGLSCFGRALLLASLGGRTLSFCYEGVPHSAQNLALSAFSTLQLGQYLPLVYCIRCIGARKRPQGRKLCSRCTTAPCASTPGSAPTRAVKVLLRSRGNKSPSRYSPKLRRWASGPKRSSKPWAYASHGPGTGGHGLRGVLVLPPPASYRILCPTPTNYH